jgi:hypothetical protein
MTPGRARTILAGIRLLNGSVALLAPRQFLRILRVDPETNGAAIYALRMFGVRTVYLGYQLLSEEGDALERAVRAAAYVHASDVAAAVLAGVTGALPRRAAVAGAITSTVNTTLALIARR